MKKDYLEYLFQQKVAIRKRMEYIDLKSKDIHDANCELCGVNPIDLSDNAFEEAKTQLSNIDEYIDTYLELHK